MEYYSAIKNNEFMKFLGKWIDAEDIPTGKKDKCSTVFIAALFIIAEAGKNPDAPQQRNKYRKCGTFTKWSTTQLLKRMNL